MTKQIFKGKKFIKDNVVCRTYSAPTLQELLQKIATSTKSFSDTGDWIKLYNDDSLDSLGVFWTLDIKVDTDAPAWRGYLYYYDKNVPQDYD